MEIRYRESYLRDLKKLKRLPIYEKIYALSFETLPSAKDLRDIPGLKAMQGHPHRYRLSQPTPLPLPASKTSKLCPDV